MRAATLAASRRRLDGPADPPAHRAPASAPLPSVEPYDRHPRRSGRPAGPPRPRRAAVTWRGRGVPRRRHAPSGRGAELVADSSRRLPRSRHIGPRARQPAQRPGPDDPGQRRRRGRRRRDLQRARGLGRDARASQRAARPGCQPPAAPRHSPADSRPAAHRGRLRPEARAHAGDLGPERKRRG